MDITTHHNRQRRIVRPPGGMSQFYSHRLTEELIEVPLTKDDYLASHAIQRSISTRIIAIARQLLETAEPLDDTKDTDIDCIVAEPPVSESLFDYLIDSDRLPDSEENKRIVYELVANRLVVGIMPSACHDYIAASFTEDLLTWAASGGVRNSLKIGHGARTHHLPLTNFISVPVGSWVEKVPWQLVPSYTLTESSGTAHRELQCVISEFYHRSGEIAWELGSSYCKWRHQTFLTHDRNCSMVGNKNIPIGTNESMLVRERYDSRVRCAQSACRHHGFHRHDGALYWIHRYPQTPALLWRSYRSNPSDSDTRLHTRFRYYSRSNRREFRGLSFGDSWCAWCGEEWFC